MRDAHSCLNATIGSIRAARNAGTKLATKAVAYTVRIAITIVIGSKGVTSCGFRRRRTLIPKGTRTAFRAEGEQFRSVATLASRLCRKCSSSSRKTYPERSAGRARKRRKGCGERGGSPFLRLSYQRPRRAFSSTAARLLAFCASSHHASRYDGRCEPADPECRRRLWGRRFVRASG